MAIAVSTTSNAYHLLTAAYSHTCGCGRGHRLLLHIPRAMFIGIRGGRSRIADPTLTCSCISNRSRLSALREVTARLSSPLHQAQYSQRRQNVFKMTVYCETIKMIIREPVSLRNERNYFA